MDLSSYLRSAKDAIIKVGEGRGFLVGQSQWVYRVVTAAHCLPHLPPAHPASSTEQRTYAKLLGPLEGPRTVSAECVFVDPISDIAVLSEPDNQSGLVEEAEAYDQFMESRPVLRIATQSQHSRAAWVLTLDGEWEQCVMEVDRSLTLVHAKNGNAPGTSGSPILTADGSAVGVISVGTTVSGVIHARQYGQPRLSHALPGWLLRELLSGNENGGAR
jgi:hypothetical protein